MLSVKSGKPPRRGSVFRAPDRAVPLPGPCGPGGGRDALRRGGHAGPGPYTRLWLRVRDGVIEAAGYQTYGCPAIIVDRGFVERGAWIVSAWIVFLEAPPGVGTAGTVR
jgi:hypothetical protein